FNRTEDSENRREIVTAFSNFSLGLYEANQMDSLSEGIIEGTFAGDRLLTPFELNHFEKALNTLPPHSSFLFSEHLRSFAPELAEEKNRSRLPEFALEANDRQPSSGSLRVSQVDYFWSAKLFKGKGSEGVRVLLNEYQKFSQNRHNV